MRSLSSILLVLAISISCKSSSAQEVVRIDGQYIMDEVIGKEVQLVDVRSQAEYKSGHIDDAVNMNVMDRKRFIQQIEALDKEEPVYLYCKSGVRSKNAAELLKKEGFSKIFDYSGGYDDWKKSKR
ncbi:MAG: rhodanese-like domain-containing protein [Bacteroidota bacterium]